MLRALLDIPARGGAGEVLILATYSVGLTSTSPGLAERADTEVMRILKDAEQAALRTPGEHRAALDALAKALIEKESIDRAEVDAIVAEAERENVSTPR